MDLATQTVARAYKKASISLVTAALAVSLATGSAAGPIGDENTRNTATDSAQTAASSVSITKPKPERFSDELWELWKLYAQTDIEFPHLRNISFAHWALESGWGKKGGLAREAKNFAGMKFNKDKKFREAFSHLCTPMRYTDHNGKTDDYCKLKTHGDFIKAYWLRLDVVSAYSGWRAMAKTGDPDKFMNYVSSKWAPDYDSPQNPAHARKVRECLKWMEDNGYLLPTTNGHQTRQFSSPQP
ncbi:MAG: glucosaminidase domain-containing protein [Alphaproteobacteria bacterium]|nr:glucosaminidase domain-containing protein [Alphaproteobacteria bacterium]